MNTNWKSYYKLIAARKENTARDMFDYCILKALGAKSNNKIEIAQALVKKAFSPVTNPQKLENGRTPYDSINSYKVGRKKLRTTHFGKDANGNYGLINSVRPIFGMDASLILANDAEIDAFDDLAGKISPATLKGSDPDYMYIVVRTDISKEQQVVQSNHATLVAGARFKPVNANKIHFAVIGVNNEDELAEVAHILTKRDVEFATFHEPDMGGCATALATAPIRGYARGRLKNLPLLKMD